MDRESSFKIYAWRLWQYSRGEENHTKRIQCVCVTGVGCDLVERVGFPLIRFGSDTGVMHRGHAFRSLWVVLKTLQTVRQLSVWQGYSQTGSSHCWCDGGLRVEAQSGRLVLEKSGVLKQFPKCEKGVNHSSMRCVQQQPQSLVMQFFTIIEPLQ